MVRASSEKSSTSQIPRVIGQAVDLKDTQRIENVPTVCLAMRPKILVIGSPKGVVHDCRWEEFLEHFNVVFYDFESHEKYVESMRDGDCSDIKGIMRLGINLPPTAANIGRGWTKEFILEFPPSPEVIVNFGHGFEDEDIVGLKARNIIFYNTTGGAETTSTVGIYLIISVFRNLSLYERMIRSDEFMPALRASARTAVDPAGRKLGVIGMGAIGQVVARQASAISMEIHCLRRKSLQEVLDRQKNGNAGLPFLTLNDNMNSLLSTIDCLILACSYSHSTHHILNEETFAKMKPGVRIVNIARGKCIDENALVDALESGKVGRAGLDVYENEPAIHPKLLQHPGVTLLPHIGGLSADSMSRHATIRMEKIQEYFAPKI